MPFFSYAPRIFAICSDGHAESGYDEYDGRRVSWSTSVMCTLIVKLW